MSNPSILVLDNSVICKPFFKEKGAEMVEKIFKLKDSFKLSIFVPDIFRHEFMNTVIRQKGVKAARESYEYICEKQFSILSMEPDLIDIASRLQEKYPRISFYDATYHAVAKAYSTTYVTADEKYYATTKKEGNITLLKDLKIKV